MPIQCSSGCGQRAMLKRPKTGDALCKECFYWAFEEEVHHTITAAKLFQEGEYVAVAASGGKDSTVLAHLMTLLNERYHYGLKLILLSVDEGITGYRDDSLETVKRNEKQYGIPLKILSYEELYGWTMDKIVQQVGRRNNCTFCGVFRRQALDRGAQLLEVDKLVTGHNADDIAETIIMNILRGDVARLQRCCAVETGSEGSVPRSKPFKYTYEKEIVMYAYFKKLDYFSTECIYSPNAYRGHARAFIKDLEKIRPSAIIDIIHSGECLSVREGVRMPTQSVCSRCGHVSSQEVCKACVLLEGLNRGRPRLGVGKSSKVTQRMKTHPMDLIGDSAEGVALNAVGKITCSGTVGEEGTSFDQSRQTTSTAEVTETEMLDALPNLILYSLALSSDNNLSDNGSPQDSVETSNDEGALTQGTDVRLTNGTNADESDKYLPNGIASNETDTDKAGGVLSNGIDTNKSFPSTGTRAKIPKRIFLPRKKFEMKANAEQALSQSPGSVEQQSSGQSSSSSEAVHTKGKCSSLPTSIEDIGNGPAGQGVCSSGGQCSADCKNKSKKSRKVVSLKNNQDLTLKMVGISKKDLDF